MAGPKIRKKLKKKPVKKITTRDPGFGKVKPPIASVIKSIVGTMVPGLGNAAVQGFKKLIKQGYSEKEAIKMLSNPARRKMED